MKLIQIYQNVLRLPSKEAVFSLNRVGVKGLLLYLSSIILVCMLQMQSTLISETVLQPQQDQVGTYIIQSLLLSFSYSAILIFSGISIIASILLLVVHLMKRRLTYQILWKTTAYSFFLPFILSLLVDILFEMSMVSFLVFAVVLSFILMKIVFLYPKRKAMA